MMINEVQRQKISIKWGSYSSLNPPIRAMLYMGARSAKRFNQPCKELYERLKSRGKGHKVAMVAVCNKLVRQLFAVVKSDIPFDKDYHLKFEKN
ncbi:MAG: hypothetical protein R2828_01450 [Saprospiraceae bacterium]